MRFVILVLSLLLAGCSARLPVELPGIPFEVDPTLALSTPDGGVGHGCAVNGYAITARHVMWDEKLNTFQEAAYSIGDVQGFAVVNGLWSALDLVSLHLDKPVDSLPAGKAEVGATVFWFEYDFRTQANVLRGRRRIGTILRITAYQILLDAVPVSGASGTCLINGDGEVVGIVNAAWDTDDLKGAGNAVLLPELE